jgi:hypothetical protein
MILIMINIPQSLIRKIGQEDGLLCMKIIVTMVVQDGRQHGMIAYLVSGPGWYTNNKAHFHRRKPVWFQHGGSIFGFGTGWYTITKHIFIEGNLSGLQFLQ